MILKMKMNVMEMFEKDCLTRLRDEWRDEDGKWL
jgi:hypothetical protein